LRVWSSWYSTHLDFYTDFSRRSFQPLSSAPDRFGGQSLLTSITVNCVHTPGIWKIAALSAAYFYYRLLTSLVALLARNTRETGDHKRHFPHHHYPEAISLPCLAPHCTTLGPGTQREGDVPSQSRSPLSAPSSGFLSQDMNSARKLIHLRSNIRLGTLSDCGY
jgi:hypothetical protein